MQESLHRYGDLGVGLACNQILYACLNLPGAKAKSNAYYGEGNGTIHLDFVQCSGKEHSLTDCEISQNSTNHHSLDVGVKCKPGRYTFQLFYNLLPKSSCRMVMCIIMTAF